MKLLKIESDHHSLLRSVIDKVIEDLDIKIVSYGLSGIMLTKEISNAELEDLNDKLASFNVKLVAAKESVDLVEKVKMYINEVVNSEKIRKEKLSSLLVRKFGYSYSHLSNTFSKKTYITIERYFILVRIEEVKKLLLKKYPLSDIAHRLDFSSTQHLSSQFKNVTGLSTVEFMKILKSKST